MKKIKRPRLMKSPRQRGRNRSPKKPTDRYKARPSITKKGENVKSRGEKKLADWLNELKFDYVYEPPLQVGRYIFAPDFLLTKQKVYIEYFGMMSDDIYKEKTKWKIHMYKKYKIALIPTFPGHIYNKDMEQFKKWLNKEIKKVKKNTN